jgi:hypothetical protein
MPNETRDCGNCGTTGCGHQDAMRCGVGLWDWTPKASTQKGTAPPIDPIIEGYIRRIVRQELKRYATQEYVSERLRSYDKSWS